MKKIRIVFGLSLDLTYDRIPKKETLDELIDSLGKILIKNYSSEIVHPVWKIKIKQVKQLKQL